MHFTRKNVAGKNMQFSIQNNNAKRQPMNSVRPIHAAGPRLQFQYSKPNIRQNNHFMSNNIKNSLVKQKGRLWYPVVHQNLRTRLFCNTVYECDADYGTCSPTKNGLQSQEDCNSSCQITNFYTCDISNAVCILNTSGNLTKKDCDSNCFPHYDCCGNTGTCEMSGLTGEYTDKSVCNALCANFGCDKDKGLCFRERGDQTFAECSNNCVQNKYWCNPDLGTCDISSGGTQQTKSQCDASCVQNKYWCNPDLGTCDISAGGTQQTKSQCDASCVQNKYWCVAGKCTLAPPDRSGVSLDKCEAACELPKYLCDPDLGTCDISAGGTQQTKSQCDASCVQQMYACQANGNCEKDDQGTQSKADCTATCVNTTYSCNGIDKTCSPGSGTQTKSECENSCRYDLYRCNTTSYTCELQTDPLTFNIYKTNTCIVDNGFDGDEIIKFYDHDLTSCTDLTKSEYDNSPKNGFFLSWRPLYSGIPSECIFSRCGAYTLPCAQDPNCDVPSIINETMFPGGFDVIENASKSQNVSLSNLAKCIITQDCGAWVGEGSCRIRNNISTALPNGTCQTENVYYGMMNLEQCTSYCQAH